MRKLILFIAILITFGSTTFANDAKKMPKRFQSVPLDKTEMLQKGKKRLSCPNCGMHLPMFYKTNHAVKHNGKVKQLCSIHCLVATMDKHKLHNVKVVDTKSLKFIDAKSAWYVVGSKKRGTMSAVSKYAFANKKDAKKFTKKFSGEVKNFKETIQIVKANLDKDNSMIAHKKSMMAKKMDK